MTYTLILASELQAGDTIGHAWVAVEYPRDKWIVRGFYPEAQDLRIISGAAGVIKDDWDTFKMDHVRTRTFHGLTERQVMSAKTKILEYGGSLHDPKPVPRRGRRPVRLSAADTPSSTPYILFWDQCATFAIAVCRAAGLDPMPWRPQTPMNIWNYLGTEGDEDARRLPPPFRRRQ